MESPTDFQEPDESRPAKRVRLEAPLDITEEVQEEMIDDGDWDDIYGLPDSAADSAPANAAEETLDPAQELEEHPATSPSEFTLSHAIPPATDEDQISPDVLDEASSIAEVEGGVPVDAIDSEDELVEEQRHVTTTDEPSAKILEETTQVEADSPYRIEGPEDAELGENQEEHSHDQALRDVNEQASELVEPSPMEDEDSTMARATNGDVFQPMPKPTEDAEFLAAAAAQKGHGEAEWQFDSSDAESSDSDSDDSTSDEGSDEADSGSEGGYEMLDPATAAKLLMSGDGEDDDDEKGKEKSSGDRQPRTANEVKEEVVPKPDVVVTQDMKITYLGMVDRVVDNLLLIKAITPGEYQVLEYGSVLCTENREVVGAVADTIGRVQEPIYSVAFTNAKEIEDAGFEYGTKIYYVDNHSSFVFTQPLKNMKGTDASNIHDEEAGEDEIEFSDDEKEAEYKRMKKLAKREGRGGLSRGAFIEERTGRGSGTTWVNDKGRSFVKGSDAPQQQYGAGMSYDDADVQEEFYSPLRRPDNLSQLMQGGGPPPPRHGHFDRGRGRGRGDRGRGRGDRGRGRGGFDHRNQRGGRGGYGQDRGGYGQQNGHRGNAHSFPDRHNDHNSNTTRQHSLPAKPNGPQASPPQPQRQFATYQQHPVQQAPSPQTYQFNGLTFQYGSPPPQPPTLQASYYTPQQQQPVQSPGGSFPAGSYVNPAFFQNQHQQQWSPPQQQRQQPNYGGWQQQMQQNVQAQYGASVNHGQNYGGATVQQQQQQQSNNLADILRQLGGPQR